ncbi:Triosephosphate isomerase [subsurface metagenome]
MYKSIDIKLPIFEMGLKGYLYGKEAVDFAKAADSISKKYQVSIIFDPQYIDIPQIIKETENIYVFSQHMDAVEVGRGVGIILPEALKEAGVAGTLLNHFERKLKINEIYNAIKRADDMGLATLVFADSPDEAAAIAQFNPNMILAEPPELIGTCQDVGKLLKKFISEAIRKVKKINPEIIVGSGAGVKDPEGIKNIIEMGVDLTGSTSAVLKSDNPVKTLEDMVKTLKQTWLRTRIKREE